MQAARESLEDFKKSVTKEHEQKIEKLKEEYQQAYREQEIKEDEANQECWLKQFGEFQSKEILLQKWWPEPLEGGKPFKPTQAEYLAALKEWDINPCAVTYLHEFKWWRQKRKDLSPLAYINPLLES